MKKIIYYLLILFFIVSCDTLSNDEIDTPISYAQNPQIEQSILDIQNKLPYFVYYTGNLGGRYTRINHMFGTYYFNSNHNFSNETWEYSYQILLPEIEDVIVLSEDLGFNKHLGVSKIIKSYIYLTLVDFFGDVPFSEAQENNPHLDSGQDIYQNIAQLLNEAILNLSDAGPDLENDRYYNNDFTKWIKLANTLKMRLYLNTRLVDNTAIDKFNNIVNLGNYITTTEDDFEYHWDTEQNPEYAIFYTSYGASYYTSNWLMDKMVDNTDPRIRFYFYRQRECTPGNIDENGVYCSINQQDLPCSVDAAPPHYPSDMVFCSVANGYWGRDHGDIYGIPPDGYRRTTVGVYPFGGKFDNSEFQFITENEGANGHGITPILLSSWVDYMKAEERMINNDFSTGLSLLISGVQKSIDKTLSFIDLDPEADSANLPSSTEINDFINQLNDSFTTTNVTGKWNILANQFLISNYGNGIEAYNFYRRNGYPTNLQFNLNPSPGAFIRSLYYPEFVVTNNPNISQKLNTAVQVFWDNNPAYPIFPIAN